jgi:hypothetical protein
LSRLTQRDFSAVFDENMVRRTFALVFSSDPPAVDVVREDCIVGPLQIEATIEFKWMKSKDEVESVQGILFHFMTL